MEPAAEPLSSAAAVLDAVHSGHRQSIGLLVALDADVTLHLLPHHLALHPLHRLDQLHKIVSVLHASVVGQAPVVLCPGVYPELGRFDEKVAAKRERMRRVNFPLG